MRFLLSEISAEGFPLVLASGPISEQSLVELGRFLRKTCEARQVGGVIIDCGAIEGALTTEELYRTTPDYTQAVGRTLKVAYINPPAQWTPSDDRFSRDVAFNRGALLELFETVDDAVQWLRSS